MRAFARPSITATLAVLLSATARADQPAINGIDIVRAARHQIGVTVSYDPSYQKLPFPNGDVPASRGVCSDVVIRALRVARNIDLQREVHIDMTAHRREYPRKWYDLRGDTDPSIDHRRVANLMVYFKRHGYSVPITTVAESYRPGDIVTWNLGGEILHVGVVSDRKAASGDPLIIHNIGDGAQEEGILFRYRIIGHYRLPESSEHL